MSGTGRAEPAKLAKQLLYEAAAEEELHPGDSCIAVMREAAVFIMDQMKAATALSAEGVAYLQQILAICDETKEQIAEKEKGQWELGFSAACREIRGRFLRTIPASDNPNTERLQKAISDAQSIVNHGPNTSYPSRQAAQYVRDVIARLLDCLGREQP